MNEITPPERTLAALLTELTHETSTLFRQEVRLAKAELAEKLDQAGSGLGAIVVGGMLMFVAVQAFVAAAIIGLATALNGWAAALIIGAVVALVGAFVLVRGLTALKRDKLTPRRTLDTLRANTRWAREQWQ